jgi:hypothetical protein
VIFAFFSGVSGGHSWCVVNGPKRSENPLSGVFLHFETQDIVCGGLRQSLLRGFLDKDYGLDWGQFLSGQRLLGVVGFWVFYLDRVCGGIGFGRRRMVEGGVRVQELPNAANGCA